MANKNEASSSSSGEKEKQQIEGLLSQLQQDSERFADSMEKLISKKKSDEKAEMLKLESLNQDEEEFKKLLRELNGKLSNAQNREAVIAEMGGINAIIAVMDAIYSFLGQAKEYRGQVKAKLARDDREFAWINKAIIRMRKFPEIDKGYDKARP